MNTLDIPNILGLDKNQRLTLESIALARTSRDSIETDWMEQEPIVFSDIEAINLVRNRFVVDIKSIWYECLFLPNNDSKTLFVSLSGGGRNAKNRYPRFLRWKYANKLGVNILCIDDPMYKNNDHVGVRWYYGTKNTSYLKEMAPIVQKVAKELNIPYSNIYFLGSSGGGYAANYMANIMDGTNAICMNPQFYPKNWRNGQICEIFKSLYDIDLNDIGDIHSRNNLVIKAKNSVFMEIVNVDSPADFETQFIPFCKDNNITPHYGITSSNNVLTWLHCTDGFSLHGVNPSDLGILISIGLIKHYRKYNDISKYYNISLLLNEELRQKYALNKRLSYSAFWRNALSDIYYLLPNNIVLSTDLEKSDVRFYFKSIVNQQNIYYTISKTNKVKIKSLDCDGDDDEGASFTFGFYVVNVLELASNADFRLFMSKIAKKHGFKFGKNDNSIKLRATTSKVEIAVKKLFNFMNTTDKKILYKIQKYLQ